VRVPLDETAVVRLNSAGNGTAQLKPLSERETWYPETVEVKVNSLALKEARCSVFVGQDTSLPNFVDGTASGSVGDSSNKISGKPGNCVWAVWVNGDANVQASLRVTGTKEV